MKNTIPANKTKSKSRIKPLEEKISSLEDENTFLLEELYESGLRTRPTIMTQIEEKEAETLQTIYFCKEECEKITGRELIIPRRLPF